MEYLQRSGYEAGSLGYARVDGILAKFISFDIDYLGTYADGEAYMNLVPLDQNSADLKEKFFQGTNEIVGKEIEIIYPLIDRNAILFFGGGHTGLTFDIADGSDNDYSTFYEHLYSSSLTKPFAGFMNIGEISNLQQF